MSNQIHPSPTPPFYKGRGKWSFYVFPGGERKEAGEYPNEETAKAASWEVYWVWQANGYQYSVEESMRASK
jgi:hypothetical protein